MIVKNSWKARLFRLLPVGWRIKLHPYARQKIADYWGEAFLDSIDWRGRVNWVNALANTHDEEKQDRILDSVVRVIDAQRGEEG